jgi:hypothetical protein
MNKKFMFAVIAIILVVVVLVSLLYSLQSPVSQLLSKGEEYLNFTSDYQGGAETKVYLVNSTLFYGVYEESFTRWGATGFYSIANGDPCVIINGTIRNDYEKDYYFCITADVTNSKGEKIEPILTIDSPHPGFTIAYAEKDANGNFKIQIKYDAKDIMDYELFVAFEPYETPPP